MAEQIKNMAVANVVSLADQIAVEAGQVAYKPLSVSETFGLYLVAFDDNTEISTTGSQGDALITALSGKASVAVGDETVALAAGQSILLPAGRPHAVYGEKDFKMQLTVVFPKDPSAVEEKVPTNKVEPVEISLGKEVEDYVKRLNDDSREMIHDGRF
ncbi:MAG: cupin domain-containing protein [Veillonella sp.]|nr:cupin domain-containing protein [Veillonella sp.]